MMGVERRDGWRQVDGWPYEVNRDGRVRSQKTGRVLKPYGGGSPKYPYPRVDLRDGERRFQAYVHRVVARAWVEGYRPGLECHHRNANVDDCRAANLEWLTRQENMAEQWARRQDGVEAPF